jgi:hypothetical protein
MIGGVALLQAELMMKGTNIDDNNENKGFTSIIYLKRALRAFAYAYSFIEKNRQSCPVVGLVRIMGSPEEHFSVTNGDVYEGNDHELISNLDKELCADKLQFKWIRNNDDISNDITPVYPDIQPMAPVHPDITRSSSSTNHNDDNHNHDDDDDDTEKLPLKRQKLDNPNIRKFGSDEHPPVQAARVFGSDTVNGGTMIHYCIYINI